jgi:NADH-quinone oxidoreductase subunit L
LALIPGAPLVAAVVSFAIGLLGPRALRRFAHWPCLLGLGLSFGVALLTLGHAKGSGASVTYYTFFDIGQVNIPLEFFLDSLTGMMLVTVTSVGLLVAIYSTGYMHDDPGYPRYFAAVSLFVFSMTMLVLAGNFLLLFVFWEAVGLCSYLLIGFWYAKPSAAAAARKAFVVNRIGDFGFLLGIFLIWMHLGSVQFESSSARRLDYPSVFEVAQSRPEHINHLIEKATQAEDATLVTAFETERGQFSQYMTLICLLLFAGAVGKSAQFPLHVWLPDAMEGPSPVSALIHAATMVTAGVYMVARCHPLFSLAPHALLVVGAIGGFTAILAALIALTQNDLKRVLAYSTVSQLGLMFLGLGAAAGQPDLMPFAFTAALFHLFTHAFFKALLFLGAGSVMHAMGNVIDMRRFGGLRKVLPVTHATFALGVLALAAVFPFAGFWSKDEILLAVYESSTHGPYTGTFTAMLVVFLAVAFLTAFYTARAYFMTFWGEEKIPHEAGHHAHEAPLSMQVPLIVLAVLAVAIGTLTGPTHYFADYLKPTFTSHHGQGHGAAEGGHAINWSLLAISQLLAVVGIGLAWYLFGQTAPLPSQAQARAPALYQLSLNKFYLDEIYVALIVLPLKGFAYLCRGLDQVVDGLVDLVGWSPAGMGRAVFRHFQTGLVQFYALVMMIGMVAFLIACMVRAG